jgi:nucleotide-binding universal stress UspA family protein
VLWILVGFVIYRLYTFKKEIEHYAPLVTSEGDLTRKDFRILVPYTPENPDRLLKYAIRVAKENNGEVNILRIITVPNQTPLSAGVAFAESAKKAFDPLEKILDKESILNHYLVRISHEATEAILATIEEQKIDLLVMDYHALRADRKLRTLVTCDMIGVSTTGSEMDDVILSAPNPRAISDNTIANNGASKKNLVVVYDGGAHADVVLKTTSWLEHSGLFRVIILAITDKEKLLKEEAHLSGIGSENDREIAKNLENENFLASVGVEFNRIIMTESSEKNADEFVRLVQAAVNAEAPDIVVTGASVGRFNVFDNQQFAGLVDRLNCPVLVARDFTIPGVSKVKDALMKIMGR